MSTLFEDRCKKLVAELDLGSADDVVAIMPLTGGVSSDIALVEMHDRKICVKFACEKLKVTEDWYAPVERNQAEFHWLLFAATVVSGAAPALLGRSSAAKGFAMEFVEGDDVYLWKTALLQSRPDNNEAEKVGHVLGQIHQASSVSNEIKEKFQNHDDFYALRLEPYLCFTAIQHPALSEQIQALVDMLSNSRLVLVHGDVSPKNIIFRQGEPIFLDAECAAAGDPSFDVSFCLNHLILKSVHINQTRRFLLASILKFWNAYVQNVSWEPGAELEKRVCKLLPALMLARVDGKSPVEYLTEDECDVVRSMAISLLKRPESSLAKFVERLSHKMEKK